MNKLHLVMGGRVKDPRGLDFVDLEKLDLVGIYPDYASAEEVWRGHAQRTVDEIEAAGILYAAAHNEVQLVHGAAL